MLSLTRRPGEMFHCSISAENLLALAAKKKGLDFSLLCTRIVGNKATFALEVPDCMDVLRENVVVNKPKVTKCQFPLYAVEVLLSAEPEQVRWLTQIDVYPFSVPPSDEPLLFGLQAHAVQHARLIGKFVPEAVTAYQVPVLVTIERRLGSASCAGT